MRRYARVFSKMNGIIYYSNTNQSKAVAEYFVKETGWDVYDLNQPEQAQRSVYTVFERAVLVFPVYCQNVPEVIKAFLKRLNARYLTVVATYGKMYHGRVLYEIQQCYTAGEIIAAAYVPTKHSYLKEEAVSNFDPLLCVVQKTLSQNPGSVVIKKTYKNPFANIGKDFRSRMCVKITTDRSKCINCGKCERECLFGGIKNGKANANCIRCLKCVTNCPTGALKSYNRLPLRLYLKKKDVSNWYIHI